MPPCLTHCIIRHGSKVKWSNPGKGVAPSPTPWCSSYRKGSHRVTLDYGHQLYNFLGFVFWPGLANLFVSWNPREFYTSNFRGKILIVCIPFGSIVKFHFLSQFRADHLPHPVMSRLIILLSLFDTFAHYVINRFITTLPTLAILLRSIDFRFYIISP